MRPKTAVPEGNLSSLAACRRGTTEGPSVCRIKQIRSTSVGMGACAARAARGLACVRACARTPVRVRVRLRERLWTLRERLCLCVGPWIGSGRLYVRARRVVGCVWLGEFGCVCAPVCVLVSEYVCLCARACT